jgi:hypothetical protein
MLPDRRPKILIPGSSGRCHNGGLSNYDRFWRISVMTTLDPISDDPF